MGKLTKSEQCIVATILMLFREKWPHGFIPMHQDVRHIRFIPPTTSLEYHIPILENLSLNAIIDEPDRPVDVRVEVVRLVRLPPFYEDESGGYLAGYSWETNTLLIAELGLVRNYAISNNS